MASYDIALILTVEADSYDEALTQAAYVAEGVGNDGENISAVFNYERDNDNQRVLYLHPIDPSEFVNA
jgi:hypothetical protein